MKALAPIAILQACAHPDIDTRFLCAAEPDFEIATNGAGAEDLVIMDPNPETSSQRLFSREVVGGLPSVVSGCDTDVCRLGQIDVHGTTEGGQTQLAWPPPGTIEKFHPHGMSLVQTSGDGFLYLIGDGEPTQLWKLIIEDGDIIGAEDDAAWFPGSRDDDVLKNANDLQAVGDQVYVTRFDAMAWWPLRFKTWHGLVEVKEGQPPRLREAGFRGANGIVDPGGGDLIVSDYWNNRLRFVSKDTEGGEQSGEDDEGPRFASADLPIRPDNLTIDGEWILVAGQRSALLAALNIFLPFIPSPSAVIAIHKDRLHEEEHGVIRWWGGWYDGRSVSVAVPKPKGLILGQIRAPGLLHVTCPMDLDAGAGPAS